MSFDSLKMEFKKLLATALDVKCFVYLAVMFVCAVCLFAFRSVGVSQIWDGYRVLYVDSSVADEDVLACLADSGCKNVICRSAQKIPLTSFFYADVDGQWDYLSDRNAYFRDADKKYNLYYVADKFEGELERAVKTLSKDTHVRIGLDSKQKYPLVIPLLVLAVYVFFALISFKRRFFLLPALFPLLLAFAVPFYPVACGTSILLFALFLSNRVWGRKDSVRTLAKNFYVVFLLGAALLLCVSESIKCFLLSLLVLAAMVSSFLLFKEMRAIKDKHSSFTFSLIFTARQIPLLYVRTAKYLLYLCIPLFALLLHFIYTAKFSASVSASGISMPMPLHSSEAVSDSERLPNMDDYFKWAWKVMSFPYVSLNSSAQTVEVQDGDKIVVPRYTESNGKIQEKDETVMTYNNEFRRSMEKSVAALSYPAVEKFLDAQERDVLVSYSAYSRGNGGRGDVFSLLAIIFAICVPLLLSTVYYSFNRARA